MNTKSLPAVLALIAGLTTCVMSFIQHVDTVVFAKRFVIVCVVFFAIGIVISVIIQMNFKDMEEEDSSGSEDLQEQEDRKEDEETE